MARLPRYFVKGQAQHIIQRGNKLIFANQINGVRLEFVLLIMFFVINLLKCFLYSNT